MEQFDNLIKEMAEKEEMTVPNGFDALVQAALDGLPPKTKNRGLGAVKAALIAVAACAALLCTAFAASPELRNMLAEALGGFAPYAHEQKGEAYTVDGFEVKVLSTLTDGSTIRAYVQVKDLRGHRLSADMVPFGVINLWTKEDRTDVFAGQAENRSYLGYTADVGYAVYDEETETALLVFTAWGQSFMDLSNARLDIRHIYDYLPEAEREYVVDESHPVVVEEPGAELFVIKDVSGFTINEVQLSIPLTVEAAEKLTFDKDSELAGYLDAEWVELSPLGLTAAFEHDTTAGGLVKPTELELMRNPIRVRMKDGTELDWESQGDPNPSGEATYSGKTENLWGIIDIWNFSDAIDLEQVESIYVCGKYFPVS